MAHPVSGKVLSSVLLMTAMFSAMGGPAIAPALPAIRATYADIPDIEFWAKCLITVNALFAAFGAPLFGWLSDRHGRRMALVTAVAAWGIVGSAGLIPQPFWTLLISRAVLGLSLGGLLAANSAMIADSFEARQQHHMMGMQSAFASVGVVMALLLSGFLAELNWRLSFCVFLAAFPVLPFLWRIPEPPREPRPGDTVASPDRRLIPGVAILSFFGFMGMMMFTVLPTQMPFYLKEHGMANAAGTGMLLSILPIASVLAGRLYARFARQADPWLFFLLPGGFMLAGFHGFGIMEGMVGLLLPMALIGIGFGLAMPHVNTVLAQRIPRQARGRAMGVLSAGKFAGQFLSPLMLQPVLAYGGYVAMLSVSGWSMACAAVVVCCLGRFFIK